MKTSINKLIAILNCLVLVVIIGTLYSANSATGAADESNTNNPMGSVLANAPAHVTKPPSYALQAAQREVCPTIDNLTAASSLTSSGLSSDQVSSMQQLIADHMVTPSDPASFGGLYTLKQLNDAGLNPSEIASKNQSLTQKYLLVVSHGNWAYDASTAVTSGSPIANGTNAATPKAVPNIIWKYDILDATTGELLQTNQLPANPATCK